MKSKHKEGDVITFHNINLIILEVYDSKEDYNKFRKNFSYDYFMFCRWIDHYTVMYKFLDGNHIKFGGHIFIEEYCRLAARE